MPMCPGALRRETADKDFDGSDEEIAALKLPPSEYLIIMPCGPLMTRQQQRRQQAGWSGFLMHHPRRAEQPCSSSGPGESYFVGPELVATRD